MADDERHDDVPDDEAPAKTPFDNPFFLPALLWLFAAWFAWDIVTEAQAYLDYPNFNRGGLAVALVAAIWSTLRGVRERREEREQGDSA